MAKKNPAAVALAARRMIKLTPEQRSEIASKGGRARMESLKADSERKAMASKGGTVGGRARAAKLTAGQRSEIAKAAAAARWAKKSHNQ